MVCAATLSVEVVKAAVAVLPLPLSVAVPRGVEPSVKVTVPDGVLEPMPVTMAVKMTVWPKTDGFGETLTAVLLLLAFTVCVIAAEVLVTKLVSPGYLAVMG
jgi:hypothetical protein